ncbi:putative NlpC/P60-like cell-wall peptidase, partial [Apodospora peruviana]
LLAARAAAAAKLTRGQLIVKAGEKWLGKKYVFGGGDCSGPTKGGFDCSGLLKYAVCKVTNKVLPHNAQAQYNLKKGKHVKLSQIKPGDALFWAYNNKKCGSTVHHVGIYVGKDKKGNRIVLHAPHTGTVVKKAPVWTKGLCGSAVR